MAEWLKWAISGTIAILGIFLAFKQEKKPGRYIGITIAMLTAVSVFFSLPDEKVNVATSEAVEQIVDNRIDQLEAKLDQPSKTVILELPISEADKATLSRVADLSIKGNPEEVLQELSDDSKILQELESLSTNMAYRHFFRGVAYSDLGQWKKSFESFDYVVQYKADFVEAWYNRGVVLGNLSQYEEEIKSYDEAIKYRPNHSNTWNNRGIALLNLSRYEEALTNFKKAFTFSSQSQTNVDGIRHNIEVTEQLLRELK